MTLLRLLPRLRSQRWLLVLTVTAGMLARTSEIVVGATAAWLAAAAVLGRPREDLHGALGIIGVAVVVQAVAVYAEQWAAHEAAFRIIAELRVGLYDGIRRSTPRLLLQRRSGDVAAVVTNDAEALEWFYAHTVATYVVAAVIPTVAVGVLASREPQLALGVGAFGLVLLLLPLLLRRMSARSGTAVRAAVGQVHGDVVDALQGMREIVLFGAEDRVLAQVRERGRELARAQSRHGRRLGAEVASVDLLLGTATITVLLIAGTAVGRGELPAAELPVLVLLTAAVLGPVAAASSNAAQLGATSASAARVHAVLDAEANLDQEPHPADPPVSPRHRQEGVETTAGVRFAGVRFRYPGQHEETLRGVDFAVDRGETVALVGASGAGKTTCVMLLLNLWSPSYGQVLVDGTDVRKRSGRPNVRGIGYVPQDAGLLRATLAENLRLGRPEATRQELLAACRAAAIDDVLAELPDGLDTVLAEAGASLSGGQRQRLAVARALVPDPSVLVLDEPVSNVDAATATAVLRAVRDASADRAVLVVAHRRQTIEAADRVVVLAGGRVVEQGPPGVLLARSGTLQQLIAAGSELTGLAAASRGDDAHQPPLDGVAPTAPSWR